ncbi:MAG TPA: hypothetical protein VHL57_04730, partial [Flavobacteriales bacterium]|nr:hypothetical protein [Flavobacteriales bacterium]
MERGKRSPLPLHLLWQRLALALLLCLPGAARANHYLGGSISYDCQGGNNYLITLDLFLDCSGAAIVPQTLSVISDCGTSYVINNLIPPPGQEVSQLCPSALANSTCNGGVLPGVMHYQIQQLLNLPPCDNWTFSWNICCRGASADLAGTQGMYIESTLDNTGGLCDDSPVFGDQSLPYFCAGQQVNYNFGVTDPDGNTLVYSMVNAQFYTGTVPMDVTYRPGFTGGTPVPGITLDQASGQITFTPAVAGNYVLVLQVDTYDAAGNYIGSVRRDIVFVVLPCTGNAPVAADAPVVTGSNVILTGQYEIEVCNGSPFCFDMTFTDADPGTVLQVVSQAAALLPG